MSVLVLPECRFPALAELPGHKPHQLARLPLVAKRLISTPISAITVHAVMQSTPGTVRNNAKELALMSLYMQRTQRAYERYRNDLKQMQEERKARHAQELEQARMLYQLAEAEGQDYDPQQDRFVFFLPELKAAMDLFHRGVKAKRGDIPWRKENICSNFRR